MVSLIYPEQKVYIVFFYIRKIVLFAYVVFRARDENNLCFDSCKIYSKSKYVFKPLPELSPTFSDLL